MVFIYILQLEQGKYYIGKTNNPQIRLDSHFQSNGSEWTKKYKPINVLEIIPNCDDYDEDKYTIMYMDKYGINNVRGGSFTSIKLDESTHKHLNKMSNSVNNKCFNCGEEGHFANKCNKMDEEDEYIIWCCEYCDKEFDDKDTCEYHEKYCKKDVCFRCGRNGHYASSCYATRHIKGYFLN